MPTPGGLLRKGDRLLARTMADVVFVVTERIGIRRDSFSIRIRREDGGVFKWQGSIVQEAAIPDADSWVLSGRNGWELLPDEES